MIRTQVEFLPAKLLVKQIVRQVAKSLLGDYKGYLVTDGYVVYENAGEYQHCLCFAHCRRYFIEAIPLDNKGKEIPGSKGAEGREDINFLFAMEESLFPITCAKPISNPLPRPDEPGCLPTVRREPKLLQFCIL